MGAPPRKLRLSRADTEHCSEVGKGRKDHGVPIGRTEYKAMQLRHSGPYASNEPNAATLSNSLDAPPSAVLIFTAYEEDDHEESYDTTMANRGRRNCCCGVGAFAARAASRRANDTNTLAEFDPVSIDRSVVAMGL